MYVMFRLRWWIGWLAGLIVIDQVTKNWQGRVGVLVFNSGVAFSLGEVFGGWWLVVGMVLVGLSWYMLVNYHDWAKKEQVWRLFGLGLVLAGGWSNWLDRLMNEGQVRDWIGVWMLPRFNLADVWIVTGVGVLIVELMKEVWSERQT